MPLEHFRAFWTRWTFCDHINKASEDRIALVSREEIIEFFKDTKTALYFHFMALWILSGTNRVSRYQKKHSPTHTHRGHQISLSASSIYYDPWHPPYSIHTLYSLFHNLSPSFLWSTSWPHWHPPLYTPYISSPIIILFSQHMPIPSQPVLFWDSRCCAWLVYELFK